LVGYIAARPNIAAIHTFHTSGGLLLRFPTLSDQDWDFPPSDIAAYAGIVEEGVRITGYQNFADAKQPIVDLMSPGHGVFNDWASKEFGVLAMTTEMWSHAIGEGQDALFAWNDAVLDGAGFIGWYAYDHPDLGPVELGGWDRFSTSSPPEALIRDEVERNVRWVLTFADKTPQVAIQTLVAHPGTADGVIVLEADVANVGWMATATAHAAEVLRVAEPVRVWLETDNASLEGAPPVRSLGVLPGTGGGAPSGHLLSWSLRVEDPSRPASVTVVVASEKAGTVRRSVRLPSG
jgi:hypothetical protein